MTQEFQKQLETILNSALNIFQIFATFLVAFLVVLWMTLCFWTFRDIQARTRDIIAQVFATLLVFFFNIPGVLLYILVRPKETLVQGYERSLQEEYMLQDLEEREICPTCRVKTQPDFQFCFNCRTRLRRECPTCASMIKLKWAACPFCGTPQKARPREAMPVHAGLGSPSPRATRVQPPVSTALATTSNNSNLAPNSYHPAGPPYHPAPVAPAPGPQPYAPQPYADGGENYSYNGHEQVYSYQPPAATEEPAAADEPVQTELTEELAPDLRPPEDPYNQPTRDYQTPRQRRSRNGAPSTEADEPEQSYPHG
jgi:hypothetical protein